MKSMNKAEEITRAIAVLTTAKEHHIYEPALPEDEEGLLEQAQYVIEQADLAWSKNIRGPAVMAVKFAAEVAGASEGADIVTNNNGTILEPDWDTSAMNVSQIKEQIERVEKDSDLDALREMYLSENQGKNRNTALKAIKDAIARIEEPEKQVDEEALEHSLEKDEVLKISAFDDRFEAEAFAEAKAKLNNLPIPQRIEDVAVPELSRNVVDLGIDDLQKRLVDSSLCLAAATWKTAVAQIDEEHAERVANHYFQKAFARVVEDSKNKDQAVARAESDEKVIEWRTEAEHAHNSYTTHRALKEIYKGYYDTVSRVFAMKQEERERNAYTNRA